MSRRAKIVCTLGPATRDAKAIAALIDAGMDVARLNFSHGTHEQHRALFHAVRETEARVDRPIAVLADLQGPKIRLGNFAGGSATLETGAEFVLTTEAVLGTAQRASTTYAALPRDVKPGDTVRLDDGAVALKVIAVEGRDVRTQVVEGGPLSDHKGINLPGVAVSAPAMTDKDAEDLRLALALGVDLAALSFVRDPADAAKARSVMDAAGRRVPLIAKLEKPEAVARLEDIVDAFDGVMVARGDLGVEMPLEQVPLTQRRTVRLCRERGKPVIVATQMLESMIHHARPTRAEVSDVAIAVIEGADAVMLSGETSMGEHAIEATAMMARIVEAAETETSFPPLPSDGTARDAIASAAARMAIDLRACALVAFTESGATARSLSRHRPAIPIVAFTPDEAIRRQLALAWGVEGVVLDRVQDTDAMVVQMERALVRSGRGRAGESVVIVAGTPPGVVGGTNTIRLHPLSG